MNGRLLLAADVLFKNWSNADFSDSVYQDQWVFQFGSQYIVNPKLRLRTGYAYNTEVTLDTAPGSIGGVVPIGGIPAVQYLQSQFAVLPQHRLTGGVGIRDIMLGIDFDASVGGMFDGTKTFGDTTSSVKSYWVSFGFTWRCGGGTSSRPVAENQTPMAYTDQIMQ